LGFDDELPFRVDVTGAYSVFCPYPDDRAPMREALRAKKLRLYHDFAVRTLVSLEVTKLR
jgi:hypothetical protein